MITEFVLHKRNLQMEGIIIPSSLFESRAFIATAWRKLILWKTMSSERKEKEAVVYALSRSSRCYGCDAKLVENDLVRLKTNEDDSEVFCKKCAQLEEMELLRAGDAKLTRLAKKYSKVHFVVLKWSELWKTYERQGVLVEKQALERARAEAGMVV